MDATDRKHVNSSWGDTVKCRLDAGKSPTFRSQSPCMYMSNSQKVAIFFIPVLIDYLQIYVIDVHS